MSYFLPSDKLDPNVSWGKDTIFQVKPRVRSSDFVSLSA